MRDSRGDHHTQSTKQEREKDMISGVGRGVNNTEKRSTPAIQSHLISSQVSCRPLGQCGLHSGARLPALQLDSLQPPILPPSILSPKLPPSLPRGLALVPGKCYSPREGSWRAQREGTFDSDAQKRSSSCKEYPEAAAVAPGGGGECLRDITLTRILPSNGEPDLATCIPPYPLCWDPRTLDSTPQRTDPQHGSRHDKTHKNGHGRTRDNRHSKLPRASG